MGFVPITISAGQNPLVQFDGKIKHTFSSRQQELLFRSCRSTSRFPRVTRVAHTGVRRRIFTPIKRTLPRDQGAHRRRDQRGDQRSSALVTTLLFAPPVTSTAFFSTLASMKSPRKSITSRPSTAATTISPTRQYFPSRCLSRGPFRSVPARLLDHGANRPVDRRSSWLPALLPRVIHHRLGAGRRQDAEHLVLPQKRADGLPRRFELAQATADGSVERRGRREYGN
ncbi:hypothetical protein L209DRAFT_798856, partial [Thermothelomyces heterothallicus CBS 203.75]